MLQTDVLIIGSGIAGAVTALQLASNPNRQVTLITREPDPLESSTRYAQGGIASLGPDDDEETLVNDIMAAGAGASSQTAAQILAKDGPRLIQRILIEKANITFDQDSLGEPNWGQEAAHSHRRILHVGDGTGEAIISALIATLQQCPNVNLISGLTGVDLITFPHHSRDPLAAYQPIICHGVYVFDQQERTVHRYLAAATVLATGGLGRIYRNTTNPIAARGDGLAMAHRAGVRIVNAEYIQFHPTALATPGADHFLISEAVRGEGGILLTPDGHPFMDSYNPQWKDLAPRDIVSRAIHHEMETHGYSHVLLDISSHQPAEHIRTRFPKIYTTCLKAGVDITREPIPVVPAAHYFCGGILVDDCSRSSIQNLYAVGEVSCTGLHGANRLASTSLLEGLVWGYRAAVNIEEALSQNSTHRIPGRQEVPPWDESGLTIDPDPALIFGDMKTIQNVMWHYVGLSRSDDRISRAIRELRHLWNEIETFYRNTRLNDGLIGLRNAVEVALIVAQAARHNHQSRGVHYRRDAKN